MNKNALVNISKTRLSNYVSKSTSHTDLHKRLGVPYNGTYLKIVKNLLKVHELSINKKISKYIEIEKICPVCELSFKTLKGHPREKTTCSHSCSNTHFSNLRNKNYTNYRTICFKHHKKVCCICGENRIVEVHHYDEDNKNNKPDNLIPLCPTHHQIVHSKYVNDVMDEINFYRNVFQKRVYI